MNGHIFQALTFAPIAYANPEVLGIFHGNCPGHSPVLSIKHCSMTTVLIVVKGPHLGTVTDLCRLPSLEKYPGQAFAAMFCRLAWRVVERVPLLVGAT